MVTTLIILNVTYIMVTSTISHLMYSSGVQYAIISSYGLHIGHNRTDIQRPVVDSLV